MHTGKPYCYTIGRPPGGNNNPINDVVFQEKDGDGDDNGETSYRVCAAYGGYRGSAGHARP